MENIPLVLATKNKGKVREMAALLAGLPFTLLSLADFPGAPSVQEDGDTFAANARLKAEAAAAYTGQIALADDSGLAVDSLGGRPGVYSARFAGEDATDAANNLKLLQLLAAVPAAERTGRFHCAIAIALPSGETFGTEGVCEGLIGFTERGTGGFGYDPLFIVPEYGLTFAEIDLATKNRISHRAKALEQAKSLLSDLARNR